MKAKSRIANLLGIGLLILWIAGLGSAHSRPWLTWFDGLGALGAFSLAAFITAYNTQAAKVGGAIGLSIGLFILWLVAMLTTGPVWQAWWTFAFACAFLFYGISLASEKRPPMSGASGGRSEAEREKFRRSA